MALWMSAISLAIWRAGWVIYIDLLSAVDLIVEIAYSTSIGGFRPQ